MDGDEVHEDGRGEAVVGGDAEPVLELETKVHPKVCNHREGPFYSRAFSWLKAATTAFTFKTLLGHNAKREIGCLIAARPS